MKNGPRSIQNPSLSLWLKVPSIIKMVPCRYKTPASPSVCDSRCPASLRMVQPLSAIAVNWCSVLLSMDNLFLMPGQLYRLYQGKTWVVFKYLAYVCWFGLEELFHIQQKEGRNWVASMSFSPCDCVPLKQPYYPLFFICWSSLNAHLSLLN